jgi:molybdopterin/thiamine biosynthesis adenylyltransferase
MAKKEKEKKVKPLKIKVIGAGGIGLNVLPNLCRYLNYSYEKYPSVEVSLIDGDFYEERNRERQDFTEVGPKASITAQEYRNKFPRLQIWDHPVYLADHNIINLIRENDIVLVCVDNHKTRKLISDRAEELENVTVLSGGNDWLDGNVFCHVRRDGENLTPPLASKYHPEILNPTDENPADAEKKEGCDVLVQTVPQLLFANAAIATMMLEMLWHVLEGKLSEDRTAWVIPSTHPGDENPKEHKTSLENFHEVLLDLRTFKSTPRARKA